MRDHILDAIGVAAIFAAPFIFLTIAYGMGF